MKQAKPIGQENRIRLRTRGSWPTKDGVDLWQYLSDATIKYNRTIYSKDEKRALMRKYYHVVSTNDHCS